MNPQQVGLETSSSDPATYSPAKGFSLVQHRETGVMNPSLPTAFASNRALEATSLSQSSYVPHTQQADEIVTSSCSLKHSQDPVPDTETNRTARDMPETAEVDEAAVETVEDYLKRRSYEIPTEISETESEQYEEEEGSESSSEPEAEPPRVPEAAVLQEMEARRQRTLREIAVHDRIGGKYIPEARASTELIAKLQKRRDDAIRAAQELRAPFEKFQDFDAFIDELTVTDDQSWKGIEITRGAASQLQNTSLG